jgi:hypothetical protein
LARAKDGTHFRSMSPECLPGFHEKWRHFKGSFDFLRRRNMQKAELSAQFSTWLEYAATDALA